MPRIRIAKIAIFLEIHLYPASADIQSLVNKQFPTEQKRKS